MNRQKYALLIATVALIATTATVLARLASHQRLGAPGIIATPIPGQVIMKIDFPEKVLDCTSTIITQDITVTNMLPKDTSYAQRRYMAADGRFWVNANMILMGADRTSIHKPEFCLPGQGWRIDEKREINIPISGTPAYQMPVARWLLSSTLRSRDGQLVSVRGLYIFWFEADNEHSLNHWQRLWWLARDLVRKGVLQRWAYVSYFTVCDLGQEEATWERVQQVIAASVPEFQPPPRNGTGSTTVVKQ
jgi:hypothetical protein